MEGTPIIPASPESGTDQENKKEAKKKKSSRKLGSFAADLKTERQALAESKAKSESFWSFADSTAENAPGEQKSEAAPAVPEVSESEAPAEQISEFEKTFVAKSAAEVRQADIREQLAAKNTPVESAALEAVQAFYEKVRSGQDIESAEANTLAERGIDSAEALEPEVSPETPQEFSDAPIQINRPELVESERSEEPPAPVHPRNQPRRTLAPNATEVWIPGSGMYAYRGIADGRPVGMVKPEYISSYDELSVKNIPGGIVGYLIGRRRGRLKAEKKFNTVKKKLEKQVQSLEGAVVAKERRIRQIVREQAEAHPERLVTILPSAEKVAEVPKRGGEARALHEQQPVPERLGHLIVGAERIEKSGLTPSETSPSAAPEKIKIDKNIETLSRAELLSISEKIVLDGSTLHHIYETSLVGERGLRRLVQEHLRGGDVKKALRREIVEREIDFERDPAMRDHTSHDPTGAAGSLQALLARQSSAAADNEEEVAFYKARASFEASQHEQQRSRRQIMDASLVGLILILCAAIIVLYLRR